MKQLANPRPNPPLRTPWEFAAWEAYIERRPYCISHTRRLILEEASEC
jgi:hypothetical protein